MHTNECFNRENEVNATFEGQVCEVFCMPQEGEGVKEEPEEDMEELPDGELDEKEAEVRGRA